MVRVRPNQVRTGILRKLVPLARGHRDGEYFGPHRVELARDRLYELVDYDGGMLTVVERSLPDLRVVSSYGFDAPPDPAKCELSSDVMHLVCTDGKNITFVDVRTGVTESAALRGESDDASKDIAFAPSGRRVLCGGDLWDMEMGARDPLDEPLKAAR